MMDFGYELKPFRSKGILILEVHGELTSLKSREFVEEAQQYFEGGFRGLLVDLSKVNYLDSTGLGACIRLFAASEGRGWCKGLQIKADGTMDSLISFADFPRIAPVFRDRDRALEALHAPNSMNEEAFELI